MSSALWTMAISLTLAVAIGAILAAPDQQANLKRHELCAPSGGGHRLRQPNR